MLKPLILWLLLLAGAIASPTPEPITVEPDVITFEGVENGPWPESQSIRVTTSNGADWTSFDTSPFFDTWETNQGASGYFCVLVPHTDGFSAGNYSDFIVFSSPGLPDRVVNVYLFVVSPVTPTPSPSPSPSPTPVEVSDTRVTLSWDQGVEDCYRLYYGEDPYLEAAILQNIITPGSFPNEYIIEVDGSVFAIMINNLPPDVVYFFGLTACRISEGVMLESLPSNIVSAVLYPPPSPTPIPSPSETPDPKYLPKATPTPPWMGPKLSNTNLGRQDLGSVPL